MKTKDTRAFKIHFTQNRNLLQNPLYKPTGHTTVLCSMQTRTSSFRQQVFDAAKPWQHLLDAFDLLESAMLSILIMSDNENLSTRNKIVSWWHNVLQQHMDARHEQEHDAFYDLSCRVFCTHSIHVRNELLGGDAYTSKMHDDLMFYEQLLTV